MKREDGVTLLQLIVTILVMIILAGASISFIVGENSIIKSAQEVASGLDKEKLELGISEMIQAYTNEAGTKARGEGIDTFLKNKGYIEENKTDDGSTRIFYKVNIEEILDEDIDTGHGIEIDESEWTENGGTVPKSEYMKERYFLEVLPQSSTTARIKLLYIDRNGDEATVYEFEDVYNIDN